MTVIEIISFVSSEDYRKDNSAVRPALNKLSSWDGYINSWFGTQVEDPTNGILVAIWDTRERRDSVSVAQLAEFRDELKVAVGGTPDIEFATASGDPTQALSASLTQIVIYTLKPGKTEADLATPLTALTRRFPGTWGPCVDHKGVFLLLVGWPSWQDHDAYTKTEEFQAETGPIMSAATMKLIHARFKAK